MMCLLCFFFFFFFSSRRRHTRWNCDWSSDVCSSDLALRGRTLTCWPSIAIDVKNAGGLYVDRPVVEDGNLITSRKPDDVPLFAEAILRALKRAANAATTNDELRTTK